MSDLIWLFDVQECKLIWQEKHHAVENLQRVWLIAFINGRRSSF